MWKIIHRIEPFTHVLGDRHPLQDCRVNPIILVLHTGYVKAGHFVKWVWSVRSFEDQKQVVMAEIQKLAELSPGGGLYIEDIDCSSGVYSISDIVLDDSGHVRIEASMWNTSEVSKRTGYIRD